MLDLKATVIAIGAAFIAGALPAWWITADYKESKYQTIIATMRIDAADKLQEATLKAINAEREHNRIAQQLEVASNEIRTKLDEALADNLRLASEFSGLYDRNATAGDCPVPGNTSTPGSAPKPSPGVKLSDNLAGLLLREARRADEAAAYAKTCYDWIQQIGHAKPQ
jgi:hypothetical protein